MEGVKDVAPKLGIAAAANKTAMKAIKHTVGMALISRMIVIGSITAATALDTTMGLELDKWAIENTQKAAKIKASKPKLDEDGRNSPSNFDSGFIHLF